MPDKHLKRMPEAALNRFKGRSNKKHTGKVREYERWNKHKIVKTIRCMGGCGDALQSLIPNADLGVKQRRPEGTNIIIQEIVYVLATSNSYDTIHFQMDDGSSHLMPICKKCKVNLEADDLESFYAAGLEAYAAEDEEHNVPNDLTYRFLKLMAGKNVVGILEGVLV